METLLLTIYVLVWPVIVAGTLFALCRGFLKDWLQARRDGQHII